MKKILLIHQVFATPENPGGTRHYELAKYLVEQGFSVCVIASRIDYLTGKPKNKKYENRSGIQIHYCWAYQGIHKNFITRTVSFLSFAISCSWKALTTKNIDVIWGTSPPIFQAITAFIIAKIRRKKFYYEVRDLWVDFARELGIVKSPLFIWPIKLWEKVLYHYSDKIIVNSPGFIPYIKKHVSQEKIVTIANGVITKNFEIPPPISFFQKHSIKHSFVAIYIGNLGVANDIDTILEAAKKIQNLNDMCIVLMGGGIRFSHIKKQVESLTNVYLFPPQPKQIIPSILSEATVGIATLKDISLFNTTYPNKVFDYMAAKKPTVLAIDGVIREVIESANGGIFVAPGNSQKLAAALLHYYHSPNDVKKHGQNAFEYVKHNFERHKIAQKLAYTLQK